jgi:hypothetical protein
MANAAMAPQGLTVNVKKNNQLQCSFMRQLEKHLSSKTNCPIMYSIIGNFSKIVDNQIEIDKPFFTGFSDVFV